MSLNYNVLHFVLIFQGKFNKEHLGLTAEVDGKSISTMYELFSSFDESIENICPNINLKRSNSLESILPIYTLLDKKLCDSIFFASTFIITVLLYKPYNIEVLFLNWDLGTLFESRLVEVSVSNRYFF